MIYPLNRADCCAGTARSLPDIRQFMAIAPKIAPKRRNREIAQKPMIFSAFRATNRAIIAR
jgi:hypothetical protein